MTTEKRKKYKGNPISGAICISIILHSCILAGLVYAATFTSEPKLLEQDATMDVMMIDVNFLATSSEAEQSEQPPSYPNEEEVTDVEPDVIPEPKPEPIPDPEPEVKSEPEPLADAIPLQQVKPEEIKPKEKKIAPIKKPTSVKKPKKQPSPTKKTNKPITKAPLEGNAAITAAPVAAKGSSLSNGAKALNRTQPAYPDRARAMGIEGKVIVRFDINSQGYVDNIRIISESPKNMFSREVKRAMRRWRYESNKPTSDKEITILFKLTGGAIIT